MKQKTGNNLTIKIKAPNFAVISSKGGYNCSSKCLIPMSKRYKDLADVNTNTAAAKYAKFKSKVARLTVRMLTEQNVEFLSFLYSNANLLNNPQ